ncbi:MAG: SIS domain-containing protein [bacterium]|nr:SIS domain-containing protein [bacterium]
MRHSLSVPTRFERNILAFPEQLSINSLNFFDLVKLNKARPDGIVICGMGGSGIPGTLLQNIAMYANIDLPIVAWKDFGLPHLSFKNPLYIFVSYSGNTAETLSGLRLASKAKLKAIVTSGGAMLERAIKERLPRAVVSTVDMVPRQASGILLYGILGILKTIFPKVLAPDFQKTITPEPLAEIGRSLAKKLKDKIVLVYTSTTENHLASIFKIQLTETGKTPTFCNTYPEINHIEIVGFDRKPKGLVSLFPVSTYETEITKNIISIDQKILAMRGITPITATIPGTTPLETALNAIVLANWTGYYLAKLHGVDPEKTETIGEIKKILKEHGLSNQ